MPPTPFRELSDMSGKDNGDLDSLLDMMRAVPTAEAAAPAAAMIHDTAFETLPAYQAIKFQRDYAQFSKLPNPYYKLHAGRSNDQAVIEQQQVVNFASYDYLGLNGHSEVLAAAREALDQYGSSVSASRISAGERRPHRDLERLLADVYDTQDCVVFNSGHAAGVSSIATFVGPKDLVVHDALIHNCIMVGAQLSGATRRNFPHNDLEALDRLLLAERSRFERVLIVTEGLFSMDGDGPDLAWLIEIKRAHGCWLMVDDAHGLGVLGATGKGIFEHQGVDPSGVDLWFGTLSKTLVTCGGYVAASNVAVDLLKYHAPGFVYSVGIPASVAAASAKALSLMVAEPERVRRLAENSQYFLKGARDRGLDTAQAWGYGIVPILIGDTITTLAVYQKLLERGFHAFPILPPGVPEKSARLRFFINASHSAAQIDGALDNTAAVLAELRAAG
jgi:8-amino-7-oxononanoate synthase